MIRRVSLLAVAAALALAGCGGTTVTRTTVSTVTTTPASGQSAMGSVHPPGWGGTPSNRALAPAPVSGVATREMYDTVTLSTVPHNPFAVAGYTAGYWPTYLPLTRAFPSAHHVSIAIQAVYHAMCLDVEPGDAVPSQAGPWALADIRAGFPVPCVYSDLSEMPQVKASLASWLGVHWRARVILWLAWYRFVPGLVAGYDGVQWTLHSMGRNLDESTVTPRFLSIARPPYNPAPPKPRPKPSRAQVVRWTRARASSENVLLRADGTLRRDACVRPYRRAACRRADRLDWVMRHRIAYYTARLREA